jgi:hypothetical protein
MSSVSAMMSAAEEKLVAAERFGLPLFRDGVDRDRERAGDRLKLREGKSGDVAAAEVRADCVLVVLREEDRGRLLRSSS